MSFYLFYITMLSNHFYKAQFLFNFLLSILNDDILIWFNNISWWSKNYIFICKPVPARKLVWKWEIWRKWKSQWINFLHVRVIAEQNITTLLAQIVISFFAIYKVYRCSSENQPAQSAVRWTNRPWMIYQSSPFLQELGSTWYRPYYTIGPFLGSTTQNCPLSRNMLDIIIIVIIIVIIFAGCRLRAFCSRWKASPRYLPVKG